jgi:hypothetical protein
LNNSDLAEHVGFQHQRVLLVFEAAQQVRFRQFDQLNIAVHAAAGPLS